VSGLENPEVIKHLEELERLKEKEAGLKRRIRDQQSKISAQKRKERTRLLIQIGGLAEIAELTATDKGILLGGFLALAKTIKEAPAKAETWKRQGDLVLKEREARRRTSCR
jgi:hypothetical protein